MKIACLLCTVLFTTSMTHAAQVAAYPAEKPLIDLSFPDGWEIKNEGDGLLAHPKDEDSFIVLAVPLESTNEEVDKAVKEAKAILAEDYKIWSLKN